MLCMLPTSILFCAVGGKVASMVEQFNNIKGTKHGHVEQINRNVEITAPILDYKPGMTASQLPSCPKTRSLSPEQENNSENTWKNNPIFASSDSDDDVPEILKRLSQNGLPSGKQLSDTLSSDMIVNSISNG